MEKPVWNVKIYGGSGFIPVCEPGFQKYGGNTTCIYMDLLINDRSKMIVLFDTGTGIRQLSADIESGKLPQADFILLIFTHLHWDHIQGFPFFSLLIEKFHWIDNYYYLAKAELNIVPSFGHFLLL